MDNKKMVAYVIKYICDRIEHEYRKYNYDGFMENINNYEEAYYLKDKGIEKRIQRQLMKRLNVGSEVQYEFYPVGYGKLYIRLLKGKYIQEIKMPRELLGKL